MNIKYTTTTTTKKESLSNLNPLPRAKHFPKKTLYLFGKKKRISIKIERRKKRNCLKNKTKKANYFRRKNALC